MRYVTDYPRRMDWEELLDLEQEWDRIVRTSDLPPIRTPAYWDARRRRIARLKSEIEAGTYRKPAELVAEHILFGRLKWGEALIDEDGRRRDETYCTGET